MMTIAIKAALLAAATLGLASTASAADFVTYRITTTGTGTRMPSTPFGLPAATLTDLVFDYTVPFADVASGHYWAPLPGQHGLFADGQASLWRIGSQLVINDTSLASIPGYAATGFARGTLCLAGTGDALPTGAIAIDASDACGGTNLDVSIVTRDSAFTYSGAFTGLTAILGDGSPDSFGIALAVPEPSSWALMLAGFALTGYALRRRKVAFA